MGQFEIRGQLPRWSGAGLNFFHEWRHSSFGWLANLCHTRSVSDPPPRNQPNVPAYLCNFCFGWIYCSEDLQQTQEFKLTRYPRIYR
jgi:hypothetical protein